MNETSLVDAILDQLEPLIARQRKALADQGCFRQVSSTQLHVLLLLNGEGRLPMSRLAEQLSVSLPNVTGIIERMVERGIVERARDTHDRRVVDVAVTQAGQELLGEIDMIRREQLATVISRLTTEQQRRALRTFTELREAAEALHLEETETQLAQGDAA